ncbi:MAG TPA: SMC-Scp complex subunit ScpB [Lacipirellulaceae bacterium]|nr:SMC-Scp complex subunit ScpB [Lacipirellulaceae bacterium]
MVLSSAAMQKSQQSPEDECSGPAKSGFGTTERSSAESPLSLSRLREAFAAMLGEQGARGRGQGDVVGEEEISTSPCGPPVAQCEINPRSVVEAMLFVGRPDNGSYSARELAAAMRGVSPAEVEAAIAELNSLYNTDGAPYWIDQTNGGYRMVLRGEFDRMRDKFYGRVKEARLPPSVMEVLSILAYNQPATAEQVSEIRGAPSGSALATLVRRRLVKLERAADDIGKPQYSTTPRFLKLFGLENLEALPRSEELEKA